MSSKKSKTKSAKSAKRSKLDLRTEFPKPKSAKNVSKKTGKAKKTGKTGKTGKAKPKVKLPTLKVNKPKSSKAKAKKKDIRKVYGEYSFSGEKVAEKWFSLAGGAELMEHQMRVVKHFEENDGLICFHLPGSGKTLTACASALRWLNDHPDGLVFAAVPGPLISNFIEQGLKKFYRLSHNYIAKHFIVDTYLKLPKYVKENGLINKPFFLIIDEAHKLKTKIGVVTRGEKKGAQKGKASSAMMELSSKAEKVLVMTGTIFRNTEQDLANLVAFAKKGKYADVMKSAGVYNPVSKSYVFDLTEMRKYFKCILSYYSGDDSEGYPEIIRHSVKINMSKKYWKNNEGTGYLDQHNRIREALKARKRGLDDETYANEMYVTEMRKASNKIFIEGENVSDKAKWVAKFIKQDPKKKTIIYSYFIESGVKACQKELMQAGIKSTYLDAKLKAADKNKIIKDYNDAIENVDGEGIIFITSATSVGIDFKGTRREIIMERDFSSAGNRQIEARGARYLSHDHLPPGERKVDIYYLSLVLPEGLARPVEGKKPFLTIDERVEEINLQKDQREEALMRLLLSEEAHITIETDPSCSAK